MDSDALKTMRIQSPLCLYNGVVPTEWIDNNGHMNVAYYVLAFDHATDALMSELGMGQDYLDSENCSAFVVESHVNYQRELVAGDPMRITTQLLGFDSKRIHYFHRMYHAEKKFLSATTELIVIHVDMNQRHSVAMPLPILDRLGTLMTAHAQLPKPPQSGRVIGVRAKPKTLKPSERAKLQPLTLVGSRA
ncbi:MAG: thioesterase-like protein [Candidatus Contendobacter odensis]|uniref:Thioesterase-like protein n=1 Tax=Candidatus Contendibacter odensensis TaxID=1400860 RepID=A0A2G6PHT0_9GAMM|nr:MAG: thioesterase-like protein [Candidatus Contendobacter odensis]